MAKSTSIVKAIIVLSAVLFLSSTYSLFTKGAIYRIFFYGQNYSYAYRAKPLIGRPGDEKVYRLLLTDLVSRLFERPERYSPGSEWQYSRSEYYSEVVSLLEDPNYKCDRARIYVEFYDEYYDQLESRLKKAIAIMKEKTGYTDLHSLIEKQNKTGQDEDIIALVAGSQLAMKKLILVMPQIPNSDLFSILQEQFTTTQDREMKEIIIDLMVRAAFEETKQFLLDNLQQNEEVRGSIFKTLMREYALSDDEVHVIRDFVAQIGEGERDRLIDYYQDDDVRRKSRPLEQTNLERMLELKRVERRDL